MRNFVLLIFLEFIVVIQASKSRSVNVALETVLEFDNKDDVELIDTMQSFLRKLKATIARSRSAKLNVESNKHSNNDIEDNNKEFVFSDFLTETMTVLRAYKDEDLKKFFNTLDKEIKTLETRKGFNEMTDKLGFRRLIDRNLQSLKNSPANEIRRKLNSLSENLNFGKRNKNNGFVANFLNYFYKKESEANLVNFLNNLKLYRSRTRRHNITDLKRTIRSGIMAIIDPLINLNSKALNNINKIYYKFIENNTVTKHKTDLTNPKNNIKPKILRQKHRFHTVSKDNEILDYIEDHIRIIDDRLTTADLRIKSKLKSLTKKNKSTKTTNKNTHTTKYRKDKNLKRQHDGFGKVKINSKKHEKHSPTRVNAEAIGALKRKPIMIKLVSNDNSKLKSLEQYLSSTTKRPTRYKKSTRRKTTTKKPNTYFKTTKKSRKAFRTTASAEGLSIEHFGSLFGREFHRKSNDNDTFVQVVVNSPVPPVFNETTLARYRFDGLSEEMRRRNNVSRGNEEYNIVNHYEIDNVSKSLEVNTKSFVTVNENNKLTESIKIKGNIIIENPIEATTLDETEHSTTKPISNITAAKHFNISIVTKYFNIQPMKPAIVLRGQDLDTSDTNVSISKSATELKTVSSAQINVSASESDKKKINVKTTEDVLENEIEGNYNVTTIPMELDSSLKEIQVSNGGNKKNQDEIVTDSKTLIGLPSTKSTDTAAFADPFDNRVDNADITHWKLEK